MSQASPTSDVQPSPANQAPVSGAENGSDDAAVKRVRPWTLGGQRGTARAASQSTSYRTTHRPWPKADGSPGLQAAEVVAPRTFVEPSGYAAVVASITTNEITVVEVAPGTGARTTVITALERHCIVAFELDPAVQLAAIEFEDLPACAGLILDRRRSQIEDADFALRRLAESLERAIARLVILVAPGHADTKAKVAGHVRHRVGPDPEELFLSLTAGSYGGDASAIRTLLVGCDPEEVQAVAGLVVDGASLEDAINSVVQRRSDSVVEMLDAILERASTDDGALVVAAVILGGLPESAIHRGAETLRPMLGHTKVEIESTGGFPRSVRSRLETLGLQRSNDVQTDSSADHETTILLKDPALAEECMLTLWREFDLAPSLQRWFRELVLTDDADTTVCVATAVALLYSRDSGFRACGLVDEWAKSGLLNERVAAAIALGTAASEYDAGHRVLAQLFRLSWWSPEAAWTVALTLQFGIAEQQLSGALDLVSRLARVDDRSVRGQVVRSLASVFLGAAEQGSAALGALSGSVRAWHRTTNEFARTLLGDSIARFLRMSVHFDLEQTDAEQFGRLLLALSNEKPTRTITGTAIVRLLHIQKSDALQAVWTLGVFGEAERPSLRLQKLLRDTASRSDDATIIAHTQYLLDTIGWHRDTEDHQGSS